jgi:ubiquitin-protein ligase
VDNIEKFQTNSDIHNIHTRQRYNLHMPNTIPSKYQKGVYHTGMKLSNNLPVQHTDITFMCQTLSVNIKKEFTILKLRYSIIFLPPAIKKLNNDTKKFKPALKEYFLSHPYSIEEFTLTKNSQLL